MGRDMCAAATAALQLLTIVTNERKNSICHYQLRKKEIFAVDRRRYDYDDNVNNASAAVDVVSSR